jgi:hypothetical protein
VGIAPRNITPPPAAPFTAQLSLAPPLAVALLTRVAGAVARGVEPRLRRKRVNRLGALVLDADTRALVRFFLERVPLAAATQVRERFARLVQLSQLLNADAPADAVAVWQAASGGRGVGVRASTAGGGAAGWELAGDEVRAVLAMRSDFAPAEVARALAASGV